QTASSLQAWTPSRSAPCLVMSMAQCWPASIPTSSRTQRTCSTQSTVCLHFQVTQLDAAWSRGQGVDLGVDAALPLFQRWNANGCPVPAVQQPAQAAD